MTLRALNLRVLLLLLSLHSSYAYAATFCESLYIAGTSSFKEFPEFRGQQVQVAKIIQQEGGQQKEYWVGGTETALTGLSAITIKAKNVLDEILYSNNPNIETSGGISGSAARYKIYEAANDLDFEAQLIVKLKDGDVKQLFDPKDANVKLIAEYFQSFVESVLKKNKDYRFIEMKAGEFLDPKTNTIEGVKWWIEDLRRGYKTVIEPTGPRTLTLAQAIAEPARIKIDWAVPATIDPLNKTDFTEASVLYRLGARAPGKPARLRISDDPARNESLPIRPTSVALSKEDLAAALEVSANEKSVAIEAIHQSLIKTIEKYAYKDRLKVVRRTFALLSFWENGVDYATYTNRPLTNRSLLDQFRAIMIDPSNIIFSRIRARAEIRQIAKEHNVTLPSGDDEWLALVKKEYGVESNTIEGVIAEMSERIEKRLSQLFNDFPEVPQYVNFIRKRSQYLLEGTDPEHQTALPLTQNPVFISLKPETAFIQKIAKKLPEWRKKYPLLQFHDIEDLHMTLRFSGRLTQKAIDLLQNEVNLQAKGASGATTRELKVNGGKLTQFGRKSQLIALKFDSDQTLSKIAAALMQRSSEVGGVPEKTFFDFVPHVTIASIKNLGSKASAIQAAKFLREQAKDLANLRFEDFEILTRDTDSGKYQRIR